MTRLERGRLLLVHALGRIGDEHAVAVGGGGETESLQDALEERVAEIGHDHGDGVVAAVHEAARGGARRIAERRDRGLHATHDLGVDGLLAVQHAGHRRLRDA
ncbi:MAG: hypothetical protein K0S05_3208, partial [Agromyces sp.]|nr:hypothetical protein [Agromyces sp.]